MRCYLSSVSVYLQVSGDGVVGSVGDHQDTVGLADHAVTLLNLPCMPVCDACTHDGHAQLGVVVVVQLPVEEGGKELISGEDPVRIRHNVTTAPPRSETHF